MKTLISVTLGLLLATGAAWAKHPPEGEQGQGKRGQHMERMQQHLGLSDDQVSQMKEIRANGGSREEMREEMRGVLSDDQQSQMREYRKNHKGKGGQRAPDQDQDEEA